MKYVKTYEGFFDKIVKDKIVKPIKDFKSRLDTKENAKALLSNLIDDINKQKINTTLIVTGQSADVDVLGKHIRYLNDQLNTHKLLIDDVDYTKYDNDDVLNL